MRIPVRGLAVAAALAALLIGGARVVKAATAPVVSTTSLTTDPGTGRPVLTLLGKSLTKFVGYTLRDPYDGVLPGTVDVLLRGKGTVVLRLPAIPGGTPHGIFSLDASLKNGDVVTVRFPVVDLSAPSGVLNDPSNPVDWSNLKGVPDGFADGSDDGAWTEKQDGTNALYRSAGRVGLHTTSPAADLHVVGDDGVLFQGNPGAGGIPASGPGTRLMWYPGKGAFRAGTVQANAWDDGNVGQGSTALGYDCLASGDNAVALGGYCIANDFGSVAIGAQATASGNAAVALGAFTTASGPGSTALGQGTTADGFGSTALGYSTSASGDRSTATGFQTRASGFFATAMGSDTAAAGTSSTALGDNTSAQAMGSVVLGRWNLVAGDSLSWVATDPVLVVGNGSGAAGRSNAFTLLKNGDLTIAGSLTQNSDLRMKKDVVALTGVLGKIAALRGVSYAFRDPARAPAGRQIGLVAQEVREQFPELVREDPQGHLSVSYQNFTAVLLEAVKEQQGTIDAQRKELDGVKARLARLEALLEKGR